MQKTQELNLTPASHMGLWATVLMTSFGTWGLPPVICKLMLPEVSLGVLGPVKDLGPHFACAAMIILALMCIVVSLLTKNSENINEEFYDKTAVIEA